ncbi:hypothetical protein PHMEG_00039224, partial [Phytophthora megakarya]
GFKEIFQHGEFRGEETKITLGEGEHITGIEAHWGSRQVSDLSYINYIKLTTNKGNSLSCGVPTDNVGIDTAKEGHQLGGFVIRRNAGSIATVAAIWTAIEYAISEGSGTATEASGTSM